MCVLNHASSPAAVADFVGRARASGVDIPFIASVAVFTDERSARVLDAFPGLELDPEVIRAVLNAADPQQAGIVNAVSEAKQLLDIDGVVGVNVSGLGSARGVLHAADIKAAVGRELLQGRP